MNLALHHSASTVVLDVALPSVLRHEAFLIETLLFEKVNGQVISIGQEILKSLLLSMCFEFIHQSSTQTFHLLRGSHCQEDNLCKPLRWKRAEDTATYNLRSFSLLLLHDYHGLVLAVHYEFYNVRPWHLGQLLGDNVLKVNKMPHAL